MNHIINKRLIKFDTFQTHPWLRKLYNKLKKEEILICYKFIKTNELLNQSDFEIAINRMFLDNKNKPKNYTLILELLSCANS